jgi:hypothetical protein
VGVGIAGVRKRVLQARRRVPSCSPGGGSSPVAGFSSRCLRRIDPVPPRGSVVLTIEMREKDSAAGGIARERMVAKAAAPPHRPPRDAYVDEGRISRDAYEAVSPNQWPAAASRSCAVTR